MIKKGFSIHSVVIFGRLLLLLVIRVWIFLAFSQRYGGKVMRICDVRILGKVKEVLVRAELGHPILCVCKLRERHRRRQD